MSIRVAHSGSAGPFRLVLVLAICAASMRAVAADKPPEGKPVWSARVKTNLNIDGNKISMYKLP